MSNVGIASAFELEENVYRRIKEFAIKEGYDESLLIRLWNVAAEISIDAFGKQRGLIFSRGDKRYSVKGANIIYNQKEFLNAAIEMALTMEMPHGKTELIKLGLYLVYRLGSLSCIELNEVQADILVYCHENGLYNNFVPEEKILVEVEGASRPEMTTLCEMGCIEIIEGKIRLRERVIV